MSRPRNQPAGERRKRSLPKYLTRDEVSRLLDAPNLSAPTGLRNRCMLELMYRAGLRVGETCSLQPRDVDVAGGTIRILGGKGGDGTSYFAVEPVRPLLEQWLIVRRRYKPGPRATLFCTLKGTRLTERYVQYMVGRMKRRAGITAVCTPHVLRHSFATHLLEEGFSIREIQDAMRHADISTTERYTHVLNTQLRDRIQRRRPL